MSCFPGKMDLYPCISIDRFDGENLASCAFFLSHCHSDHMIGLDKTAFFAKLSQYPNIKLYMSDVSRILLLADKRFTELSTFIKVLPVEEAKIVKIQQGAVDYDITVTLLPAGHCPGSVMFLFEGVEGTCLYTGDFRLPKGSATRMKHLHSGSSVKPIDHLYIDTTFCIPDANYIPSREACLAALCEVIEDWLSRGRNHVVRLNLSAKYGYEYLYSALHKRFKTKIYCARSSHYRCLPDIADVLTTDPTHCRIFACFKTERLQTKDWSQWPASSDDELKSKQELKFLRITLSTLYFTYAATPEEVKIQTGENSYRLCFSFHSSLSEVCDFVRYLNPANIHANVIPRSGETFHSVEDRLRSMCDLVHCSNGEAKAKSGYAPLGKLKPPSEARTTRCESYGKRKNLASALWDSSDSDEEFSFVARRKKR